MTRAARPAGPATRPPAAGSRAAGPRPAGRAHDLGVLSAVVHDRGDALALVADLGHGAAGIVGGGSSAGDPLRVDVAVRRPRTRARARGHRALARALAQVRPSGSSPSRRSACARPASRRRRHARARRGTRTGSPRRPRTRSTAGDPAGSPPNAATSASVSPPPANSGTRLRRSGAPAARHWRTSMPTAIRQSTSDIAEPRASADVAEHLVARDRSTLPGSRPAIRDDLVGIADQQRGTGRAVPARSSPPRPAARDGRQPPGREAQQQLAEQRTPQAAEQDPTVNTSGYFAARAGEEPREPTSTISIPCGRGRAAPGVQPGADEAPSDHRPEDGPHGGMAVLAGEGEHDVADSAEQGRDRDSERPTRRMRPS